MAERRARKLPYREGTWFAVPLRTDGYGLGLVARHTGGGVIFGYFFGPKLDEIPGQIDGDRFSADLAVYCGKFGDLRLTRGDWTVIQHDELDRGRWPLPRLIRVDDHSGAAFLSKYSDDSLKYVHEERCPPDQIDVYPYDGTMGAGAMEVRLTKLLDGM